MWRKIEPKSTFVEKKLQIWGLNRPRPPIKIKKNEDDDENATRDVGGGWGGSVNTLSVSIIRERLTFDHTVDYDQGGVQQDQELYQLLYKHNNS